MEWSVLLAFLIGAAVAIGGVLVSQRAERRRAHADRIWKERTASYVLLYRWATSCAAFVDQVDSLRVWASEHLLDLDVRPVDVECAPLNPMERAQIAIYSSKSVRGASGKLEDAVARLNARLKSSHDRALEPDISKAVHSAADGLKARIVAELGRVD